ncbi:integrase [Comamonas testosteroni]|uniref:Integrase n=1 Tax=Comamonas testosteroni TaxID=285 RepID=A0A0L7MPY3_COMTE|nr:recombinase family protein [Comamonas testosteroni]KOC23947.1 integrase [Comamonas testosteroni]
MGDSAKNGLVYSYLRFSDPKQSAGGSTDRQLAYAAKWAAEHDLKLDTHLSLRDEGLSAYHQQHIKSGALGVFLRAVEEGRVPFGSVLIVEGLDRLSRAEPIQAQAQLAQIVNAGITVVTASDGKTYSRQRLKDNPMDLVYSLLVMIRAHEESDTKSKRVKASVRRLCEKWIDGSYRGRVEQGHDPAWLTRNDTDGWDFKPETVKAILRTIEMYKQGLGGKRIIEKLNAEGLRIYPTSKENQTLQVYRVTKMPQLAGHKPISVDGDEYLLKGYYPPLLSELEWEDLQRVVKSSGRRRVKGDLPHVITGIGITFCGYCGHPMAGQHLASKKRLPDGRIRDGYRRLLCSAAATFSEVCPVRGSTSVAPIERAIMSYCSDMMNLQGLFEADTSSESRKELLKAQKNVEAIKAQLDKLTDAMLASADEGIPLTFARRARQLEEDLAIAEKTLSAQERDIAMLARRDISGADEKWRALAAGVEAQDIETRLQARQLVADTFSRISVYHHGLRPNHTPKSRDYYIDLMLVAKGGSSRWLRIDRDGNWVHGENYEAAD